MRSKQNDPYRRIILTAAVALLCALLLSLLAGRMGRRTQEQQAALLKDAITRAAISCYAIEGRYPRDLQYIIDNYGVIVNSADFIVSYEAYAGNLMPDIHVYGKGEN